MRDYYRNLLSKQKCGTITETYCQNKNAGLLQKLIVKTMLFIPNCGKIKAGILFKTEVKIKATYIKIRKFQDNLSQNYGKKQGYLHQTIGKSRHFSLHCKYGEFKAIIEYSLKLINTNICFSNQSKSRFSR
jgi:hypothetical protein